MSLALDGLTKAYGEFELGPIDLDVDEEVLTVLGPSGCGKTTLLSTVAGIVDPDAGTVALDGVDITGRPPEKRGIGLVFQDGALFPHMTARGNVAYAATTPGRVDALAETLEISDVLDQRADTLSGGERQRVALARSLAADPDALLLDEPLANLDAPIKQRLRPELRGLLADLEIPVVYVTHDQHEATVLGDRLAVMADGACLQTGPPTEVFARPATAFVASFTGSANLLSATVIEDGGGRALDWAGRRLDAALDGRSVGEQVTVCLRPEYVDLGPDAAAGPNGFEGRIARRLFEGDGYRVEVALDGSPARIEATLPPTVDERLGLADRDRVGVALPPAALHVVDAK